MSTFNFIIPTNFSISQNAHLYINDVPTSINTAKYHWNINCGSNLNTMFNIRTYTQPTGTIDAYTANLTINTDQVNTWLTTTPGLNYDNNGTALLTAYGLEPGAVSFNLRLLEMVALEIFGHAKARAAISNDTAFNSLHSQLTTHLSCAFNDQNTRNIFFEQYVDINRYSNANTNDVGTIVDFNLANTSFFIFGFLNGNICDATTLTPGLFSKTTYSANMRIQFYSGS